MAIHVVYTRPQSAVNRTVLNQASATIAQRMAATLEMRVMEDSGVTSSAGNPTIKDYLTLEAAAGFKLQHMDNNIIVTYS